MIELVICFRCDTCGAGLEVRQVPGIVTVPSQGQIGIPNLPPHWTLTPDARVHCPAHQPRLVEPVAAVPNLRTVVRETHR